jgi:hypothetical protein
LLEHTFERWALYPATAEGVNTGTSNRTRRAEFATGKGRVPAAGDAQTMPGRDPVPGRDAVGTGRHEASVTASTDNASAHGVEKTTAKTGGRRGGEDVEEKKRTTKEASERSDRTRLARLG